MSMSINTNVNSLNAQRSLNGTQSSLNTSMARLSSGLRINSAADDAAGLGISQRMSAQVRGMNVAIRNANDGISLAQTADSALASVGDSLQRMRELAVQAANATNSGSDLSSLGKEYSQLSGEVNRVLSNTTFNGKQILASAATQTFQVGANTGSDNQLTITTSDLTTDATLTAAATTNAITSTSSNADMTALMTKIDAAIDTVNNSRADFGATQNRFNAVISNLQSASQNQAAAASRITDADFASETANLSRAQVLQQAGTAMVAQANQLPQGVLKLLQ